MRQEHPGRRSVLALGAGLLVPAAGFGACTAAGRGGVGGAAPDAVTLRLATGPEGAVYREIGGAIAEIVDREWSAATVELVYTDAAPENVELLEAGEVDLGLANIDAIADAGADLHALGRLFESVLHVVVPTDSGIESVRELDGRTLAAGLPLSGTRHMLEVVMEVLGLEAQLESYSQRASGEALERGEVDAVISLTGMPTPAVTRMSASGRYRLLSLADVIPEVIEARSSHYLPVAVPALRYPGLGAAETLAVPTLLTTTARMPDSYARELTRVVFSHADELSEARPEAEQINVRTGAATVPIPLHPGSAGWFRDQKL